MKTYLNLGPPVSLDDACDAHMHDVYEFILYRSEEDEDGERHAVVMTLWKRGPLVAHNFAYTADYDDTQETRESGDDPSILVDELPEAYQVAALKAVNDWCAAFLSDCGAIHS